MKKLNRLSELGKWTLLPAVRCFYSGKPLMVTDEQMKDALNKKVSTL